MDNKYAGAATGAARPWLSHSVALSASAAHALCVACNDLSWQLQVSTLRMAVLRMPCTV
jgi:hypothetical protein